MKEKNPKGPDMTGHLQCPQCLRQTPRRDWLPRYSLCIRCHRKVHARLTYRTNREAVLKERREFLIANRERINQKRRAARAERIKDPTYRATWNAYMRGRYRVKRQNPTWKKKYTEIQRVRSAIRYQKERGHILALRKLDYQRKKLDPVWWANRMAKDRARRAAQKAKRAGVDKSA